MPDTRTVRPHENARIKLVVVWAKYKMHLKKRLIYNFTSKARKKEKEDQGLFFSFETLEYAS